MTQKQKIWFWLSFSAFAIPELLWSPVLNTIWDIFQNGDYIPLRKNVLDNPSNENYLRTVLIIQFIGLVIFLVLLKSWQSNNTLVRYSAIFFVVMLLVITFISTYLAFNLSLNIF